MLHFEVNVAFILIGQIYGSLYCAGMHESGAHCKCLIKQTTNALSQESQRLFLSTQQNNVELCVEYGIER